MHEAPLLQGGPSFFPYPYGAERKKSREISEKLICWQIMMHGMKSILVGTDCLSGLFCSTVEQIESTPVKSKIRGPTVRENLAF